MSLARGLADQGSGRIGAQRSSDLTGQGHIEDANENMLIAAKSKSRRVHHGVTAIDRFVKREALKPLRRRIFFGIRRIDAIDLAALEQFCGTDLSRTQRRRGVGGEKRMTSATAKDDDHAVGQGRNHPRTIIADADIRKRMRTNDQTVAARTFDAFGKRHGVDHRRQHAHVVATRRV